MIRVSYESQVMVGRVSADPQNNPAVEGIGPTITCGATLAGFQKRARALMRIRPRSPYGGLNLPPKAAPHSIR